MTIKKTNKDLTPLYLNYLKTKKETYFTQLYNALYIILKSKFGNNTFFYDMKYVFEYDDIFQLAMMKLIKNKSFDANKGGIVTFSYIIFTSIIRDRIRKLKNKPSKSKTISGINVYNKNNEFYDENDENH